MKTALTAISAVALLCTMITANAAVTGLRLDANGTTLRWNHEGWTQVQLADSPWTIRCQGNEKYCQVRRNTRYQVFNLTYGGSQIIYAAGHEVPRPQQCGLSIVSGRGVQGLSVFHDRVSWSSQISGHWIQIQSRNGNRTFYQGNGRTTHILPAFGPYKIIDHSVRGRSTSNFDLARDCRAP